jgi:RES domain-containing protein
MMPLPPGWDPTAAVAACSVIAWNGHVWRGHTRIRRGREVRGDDVSGAVRVSGRWHRGEDLLHLFPSDKLWPALYTSLELDTYVWEMLRHLSWDDPAMARLMLKNRRRSKLLVELTHVADLRDPSVIGLTEDDVSHPDDYTHTQEIGAALLVRGVEGLLVPSVTRTGDNLVIFPHHLRPGSRIAVVETLDPFV